MHNWHFPPDYHKKSSQVLDTALNSVPGYRSWRDFDPGPEYPVDARYAAMPALKKKDIREHTPAGFVPPGRDMQSGLNSGEISLVKTSGTTDISVTNIWYQPWWNASEVASWKLNSYTDKLATGRHPEVILANPMNVGIISDDVDLPLEKRRLDRFLYLNEKSDPVSWAPALMDRMVRELAVFQPVILEANPSLLARLCRYIFISGQKTYQPGLIVFTYEYPTRLQIKQIKKVFRSPLVSSYGSTETGYVFMQCEAGKFHQNTEFCRVDFQPFKKEHGGPDIGRILVTTFNNPWYYMVHFDVGDLVRIDSSDKCACGRSSGIILSAVEGRSLSTTLTCENKLVTLRQVDDVLSDLEDIDEYRLEQAGICEYALYLVTGRTDLKKLEAEATGVVRKLYGDAARVSFCYENALAPESSGKYCHVKSRFPINIEDYLYTAST
jgi:phenylacetate-CoA ligase